MSDDHTSTENPPVASGADLVPGAVDGPEPVDEGLTAADIAPLVEQEVG